MMINPKAHHLPRAIKSFGLPRKHAPLRRPLTKHRDKVGQSYSARIQQPQAYQLPFLEESERQPLETGEYGLYSRLCALCVDLALHVKILKPLLCEPQARGVIGLFLVAVRLFQWTTLALRKACYAILGIGSWRYPNTFAVARAFPSVRKMKIRTKLRKCK